MRANSWVCADTQHIQTVHPGTAVGVCLCGVHMYMYMHGETHKVPAVRDQDIPQERTTSLYTRMQGGYDASDTSVGLCLAHKASCICFNVGGFGTHTHARKHTYTHMHLPAFQDERKVLPSHCCRVGPPHQHCRGLLAVD